MICVTYLNDEYENDDEMIMMTMMITEKFDKFFLVFFAVNILFIKRRYAHYF